MTAWKLILYNLILINNYCHLIILNNNSIIKEYEENKNAYSDPIIDVRPMSNNYFYK